MVVLLALKAAGQSPGSLPALTVVPPSPEAASLGRYAASPIGFYAGTPQISVPLVDLSTGPLNLPLSLSYNASGNRVEDMASWVGLGWSLSAGGVITRAVRGGADDQPSTNGFTNYFDVSTTYAYVQLDTASTNYLHQGAPTQLLVEAARGCADVQPDIFYFNFNGYTGQFLFNWQHQLVVSSNRNVRIAPTWTNGRILSWRVTTEDGTQYVFAAAEYTTTRPKTFNVANCTPATGNKFISSWYLSSVTDVNQEHRLNFSYESYLLNQGLRFTDALENAIGDCADMRDEGVDRSSQGYSKIEGLRLRRIKASSGSDTVATVELVPTTTLRTDTIGVTGSQSANLRALDRVILRDGSDQEVRTVYLAYYPGNPTGRLTLRQVQPGRLSGQRLPGYVFTYNTQYPLPADLRSRAQDHWGFYNGAVQNDIIRSLVPGCVLPAVNERVIVRDGADREVHPVYAQAGLLTQVQYPTGGYSSYVFESNEYGYVNTSPLADLQQYKTSQLNTGTSAGGATTGLGPNACDDERVFFTVYPKKNTRSPTTGGNISFPNDPRTIVHLTGSASSAGYDQGHKPFAELQDSASGQRLRWTGTADYTNPARTFDAYVPLYPGTYSLHARACNYRADGTNGYDGADMAVFYPRDTELITKKLAGGVRVRRIRDYSQVGDSTYTEKVFTYTEATNADRASGCIYAEPRYEYLSTYFWLDAGKAAPDKSPVPTICDYWLRLAHNRTSLGTMQGGFIGYREVTVTNQVRQQPFSRSVYRFTSPVEYPDDIHDEIPFAPAQSFGHRTGQLLSQLDYKQMNTGWVPVKEITHTYRFYEANLPGLAVSNPNTLPNGTGVAGRIDFFKKSFLTQLGYAQPASTVESLYDATGQYTHTQQQRFSYDATGTRLLIQHQQLSGTAEQVTSTFYPLDYTQTRDSLYAQMSGSLHVIAPIETVTIRRQLGSVGVVAATHESYGLQGDKLRLLTARQLRTTTPIDTGAYQYSARIFGNSPDQRLVREVIIDRYDETGNVTQLHRVAGQPIARLWGYGRTYLIAEVQNATYADLVTVLGQATIIRLASLNPGSDATVQQLLQPLRMQLPQARVVTETYRPLVGISSRVNPDGRQLTYEYDAFNRLVRTRDEQGRILSQQQYHYAGK